MVDIGSEIGYTPILDIKIGDGDNIGNAFQYFEWVSFINDGYVIRAKFADPHWDILRPLSVEDFLDKSRNEPLPVKWTNLWNDELKSEEREALIIGLTAEGAQHGGFLEFVAIDPPSFFLNVGNADGTVFEGTVKDVIQRVVNLYAPDINFEMDDTNDSNTNKWYLMRQDPKTFILSILDWSSSVTKKKTNWIVSSKDRNFRIKEQASLKSEELGIFSINQASPSANDILKFWFAGDSFITAYQSKLLTQGISSTTGKYLDKISDAEKEECVFIKDQNTQNKKNVEIKKDRGFKKPRDSLNVDDGKSFSGATSIMAIPEFTGGDMGMRYEEYIDGRARGAFLDMLGLVMKLKIRIYGDHRFDDPNKLGVSTVVVQWNDSDGKPYFLSGKWLVYGFRHVVTPRNWYTDLYLYRLDHDSSARKVGGGGKT